MPVEMFTDGLEPRDKEATIWRFMNLVRFKDLMSTGELYFCRADLFDDESEGLPPEDYIHVLGLNPLDIRDRQKDRKSTRLNSSHQIISYAVFCLKKKKK